MGRTTRLAPTPLLAAAFLSCLASASVPLDAGPFLDEGILSTDAAFVLWADQIQHYAPASGVQTNASPLAALGRPDGITVSLGDRDQAELSAGLAAGTMTVQFRRAILDGPGWDLAVFENAFPVSPNGQVFGELAYVEVSDDGEHFARFPSTSLTTERLDIGFGTAFSGIDPTDVHNLAGKHPAGQGTAFDLAQLSTSEPVLRGQVDLQRIRFVRIVDIPGSPSFATPLVDPAGQPAYVDSQGNPILDPWNTTPTGTAGFDLDAVGGRYPRPGPLWTDRTRSTMDRRLAIVPEPTGAWLLAAPWCWILRRQCGGKQLAVGRAG